MLHRQIPTIDVAPADLDDPLRAMWTQFTRLEDFAAARQNYIASHHDNPANAAPSLTARYAAANMIARRRFDAILREAETVAHAGATLIIARAGRDDLATISAARFLGKSIAASLCKLDNLLPAQSA